MPSLLQELLGLADGTPHGRAGHGEEISLIVAYAEGFCAGIHLQAEGEAGWKAASGASSTLMPRGKPGKHHLALPRCPPTGQAFSAWSSPQRSLGEPLEVLYLFIEGEGWHCAVQAEHVLAQERPQAQRQALHVLRQWSHCCSHWEEPQEIIHG